MYVWKEQIRIYLWEQEMKPTKQQILDEPAGPRLDAWFCEHIFGWPEDRIILTDEGVQLKPEYIWKAPSTNIYHAMEGVEKWKHGNVSSNYQNEFPRFLAQVLDVSLYLVSPLEAITDIFFRLTPLATTRALLLWAIEKDK